MNEKDTFNLNSESFPAYFHCDNLIKFAFLVSFLVISAAFYQGVLESRDFQKKCGIPLELASDSSTIEVAKEQLIIVMAGCQKYEISGDFWQNNFQQQLKILQQVSPTETVQEKFFALKQFKETVESAKKMIRNPGI